MKLHSTANLLDATSFSLTINMDQYTVNALTTGTYTLYGFKAVQTSVGGGAPLVWFGTDLFGLTTEVEWQAQYGAYTSRSAVKQGAVVTAINIYPIKLGQRLDVTSTSGTGDVVMGDTPLGIELLNKTKKEFTCGIAQLHGNKSGPFCALPLYGSGLEAFVPIERVLLSFSARKVKAGSVAENAFSQSLLIDLTSSSQRSVTYDINTGWSWGDAGWAQVIAVNSDLVSLLIEDTGQMSPKVQTLLKALPA